jgi:putative hydrolase of the HAD superfamily
VEIGMLTTVIFDLDDTLYDEIDYCRSGFRAVGRFLAQAGSLPTGCEADDLYKTLWKHFCSGNRTQTFNAAMDEMKIDYDDEVVASLISVYRRHEPTLKLPDETRKALDLLADRYTLAVLTDGYLPAQELKLKALQMMHYFKHILYTESLGRSYWKPNPKGFEMLARKLGVDPSDCVYVGDNPAKDFLPANSLGMGTIQVVRPNRLHNHSPEDKPAAPDQIIGGLAQLPAALQRVKNKRLFP